MAEGAIDPMAKKRQRKKRERRQQEAAERVGASDIEQRLSRRLAAARTALLATFENVRPGHPSLTKLQPALQAEILGIEAQLYAEQAARAQDKATAAIEAKDSKRFEQLADQAGRLRKHSRQAHADSTRWQAEARRASELQLADKLDEIERQLRSRGEFARGLAEL